MIAVVCAECGETFEIGEEFAGVTEYCPACGALNDIPDPDDPDVEVDESEAPKSPDSPPVISLPPIQHGISARLWWTILLSGIGIFIATCVFLFSGNWEERNVELLSDAANRGDVLMADDDFAGAVREYQSVLDTVDHRSIESAFILHLVDHAKRGEADAANRLKNPPPSLAQTRPGAVPAPSREAVFDMAIKSFQRDYEAFPTFVRDHTLLFLDGKGNWRQRQFVVWQLAYDPPVPAETPQILLKYDFASRITAPHSDRAAARDDNSFVEEDSVDIVHCQTHFKWSNDHWVIAHHDADVDGQAIAPAQARFPLEDFYSIERPAFHASYH